MTIGEKLDQQGGFSRGFDMLRVLLALGVVASHSFWVVDLNTTVGWARGSWFPIYMIVPSFFALGGFLVAGSAERHSLRDFLLNRGVRMAPALALEIVASAFVLGPLFTTLPLADYFAAPQTWRYLTNILGLINYQLPGVFEQLPSAGFVNASLWSIPFEFVFYAVVAGFIITGLIRRRAAVLALTLAWAACGVAVELTGLDRHPSLAGAILSHVFIGRGPRVVVFALAGVAAYQFRHLIPYSRTLLVAAVAGCLAIWAFAAPHIDAPSVAALAALPLVYLILFVGVTETPPLPVFHRGDYSYGVYLYGFPLQQTVKALLPGLTQAWAVTAVSVPLIVLFAAFSWHCLEKPTLRLRRSFSVLARTRREAQEAAAAEAAAADGGPEPQAAPAHAAE